MDTPSLITGVILGVMLSGLVQSLLWLRDNTPKPLPPRDGFIVVERNGTQHYRRLKRAPKMPSDDARMATLPGIE